MPISVTVTSTKLRITQTDGTELVFDGRDVIRVTPVQINPPGGNTVPNAYSIKLDLTGTARELFATGIYEFRLQDVGNQPTWTPDKAGGAIAANDIGIMVRSASGGGGGGQVDTVTGGVATDIDATDPANLISNVKVDGVTIGVNGSNELEVPAGGGGYVPTTRLISTTAPLTGGGDLSANRTFAMPAATNAVDGYLTAADHTAFAAKQPAGNYITDLSGDVVATGPGAVAATIQPDSVTFAKMANIPTATLIGRTTAAAGDPENITIGTGLAMSAGTLGRAALTGDVTAPLDNNTLTIAADAVTNAKLADVPAATFKGSPVGAGTVNPIDLTANQGSTILDTATDPFVRTSALPAAGITQLTGDVTAGPGSGSQAATIANNAVTNAKLRDSGALSVIGRSANSAGDPADISASAASDAVLRESGSTVGFGTVATGGIANAAVTYEIGRARKFLANNTAGSASVTEQNFNDPGNQALAAAVSFTAGLDPATVISNSYNWTQVGNLVTYQITLRYTTAGTTVTNVNVAFPADMPSPLEQSGMTAASQQLYPNTIRGANGATGTMTSSGTGSIRRNSGDTAYEFNEPIASGTYSVFWIFGSYFTA